MQHRELPNGWDKNLPTFPADAKGMATRDSSGKVLNAIAQNVPWLIGGSADLATPTKTRLKFDGAGGFQAGSYGGPKLSFRRAGTRHGGGLEWHGGVEDSPLRRDIFQFQRLHAPAIRLAALMEIPVIYIFTHDSIGLGEDGPTHQPIEQLAVLRAMPGLVLLRPADANEVVECVEESSCSLSISRRALVLTRQAVPTFDRTKYGFGGGSRQGSLHSGGCAGRKARMSS